MSIGISLLILSGYYRENLDYSDQWMQLWIVTD